MPNVKQELSAEGAGVRINDHFLTVKNYDISVSSHTEMIETSSALGHHQIKPDWVELCDNCNYPIGVSNVDKAELEEHVCPECDLIHEVGHEVLYYCPNCGNSVFPVWEWVPPSMFPEYTPGITTVELYIRPGLPWVEVLDKHFIEVLYRWDVGNMYSGQVVGTGSDQTIFVLTPWEDK